MNRKLKHICSVMSVALIAHIFLNSCKVSSVNSVDIPSGTEVDAAPYLGEWTLSSISGMVPQQAVMLSVEQTGTNITTTFGDGASSYPEATFLTQINGDVVACSQWENGLWDINKVVLNANSNEMSILPLSRQTLRQAVEDGIIAGEVTILETNYFSVRITADAEAIRSYISQQSGAFYTNCYIFTR